MKLLVDKSKVENYKYYVKRKIKDWSLMEYHLIQLIKNNSSTNPEGWVHAQCVFINKELDATKIYLFSSCLLLGNNFLIFWISA